MKLREYKDSSGKKVTTPTKNTGNSSGNKSPYGSFKNRLRKLIDYAKTHRWSKITNVEILEITDDSLKFIEHYDSEVDITYDIYIGALTEAWRLKIYSSVSDTPENPILDASGMEWVGLLKTIREYIMVPVVGTPDYKDLLVEYLDVNGKESSEENTLTEFVDKNGNKVNLHKNSPNAPTAGKTSSKANKEKFEELVAYMDKYKDIYTAKTEVKWISDTGFEYVITRKSPGVKEYTITLELTHSRFNSSWQFETYRNYDYVEDGAGQGWKELLKALSRSEFGLYTNIPASGSKEYDSLTESASFAEDFKEYENLWD